MKKIATIMLAALMAALLLAGCGTTTPPANDTTSTAQNTSTAQPSTTPDPTPDPTPTLSGVVKTGGSTSVSTVMKALIFQFQEDNKDVTINYEENGSGDGIKNTISEMYEIGHSSRELKTDGSEDGLTPIAYAIDGIAIVVNKDNGVEGLTKDQVRDIYTGKITNWKEVGGKDALITVVTREPSSGTRSAFAEIIGLEKKIDGNPDPDTAIVENATEANSTGAVQTQVAANPDAIGYMSFSDADATKINIVKYEGVAISTDTLKDGSYKLKREFFLLTKDGVTLSAEAQAFIDFIMSDAGQAIVKDNKLLPIK